VSDEVVVGNRFDPRHGDAHPEKGFTHLRIFAFQGLADLLHAHGLLVQKLVTSGFYPLPPALSRFFCRLDPRHGAFLIARVVPGVQVEQTSASRQLTVAGSAGSG